MSDQPLGPTSASYISQRLRLHYVDWGNAEAPPLILLHGGRDHCRNWDWVAQDLRRDFHVIAPDLRGHGDRAYSPSGDYSMSAFVYDLAQLSHRQKLAMDGLSEIIDEGAHGIVAAGRIGAVAV